jgi:hypothetical protein
VPERLPSDVGDIWRQPLPHARRKAAGAVGL